MYSTSYPDLNQRIISDFLQGKTIAELAIETNLDTSYITLVLYQEGIHYSYKEALSSAFFNSRAGKIAS